MAALCTGNYGLTQNRTDDSKEYFFVKLTDSAYRAVEDYQRNQNKYNTQATIQIIGGGGVLSFPTAGGIVGQQFSFSIDEIEGSFECIRQTQNNLDVLGALPYKMRIHANDDVYETTRHRMAVAEENQKNKCTREIKPNQTDIGRKVKLKTSSNRLPNIPPKRDQILTSSSQSPLSSSNSMNPLASGSTTSTLSPIGNNGSTLSTSIISSSSIPSSGSHQNSSSIKHSSSLAANNNLNNLTSTSTSKLHSSYNSTTGSLSTGGVSAASSLSSALSSAAGSGTSGINSGYYNNNNSNSSSGGLRSTNGGTILNSSLTGSASRRGTTGVTGSSSSSSSNSRIQKNGTRHMPDITKRKIRERLIHLLALKPFKKPELYARLQNEGIRDRERALITTILKEISSMRDNTYNLKRQIWNDVNEDWPFYTEQELQMLKRRKPQNLTPPLSSDGGSSTSGQSPTSTHNGSPPPAVKRPSLDRDRFYEEPISKKTRISHFRKETNEINRRGGMAETRDSYNMNPRTRDNHDNRSSSNYYGSNTVLNKHHPEPEENAMGLSYAVLGSEAARRISPRDELIMNGHSNSIHHSNVMNSHHHSTNNNSSSNKSSNLGINSNGSACQRSPSRYSHHNSSNKPSSSVDIRRQCSSPITTETANGEISMSSPGAVRHNRSPPVEPPERENIISSTTSQNQDSNSSNSNNIGGPFSNNKYDFSQFTKIVSIEQRRLYKTEFEKDYKEYRELLNKIESVGQRFKVLAQRLDNARNNDDYRVIKRQILAEYDKINRDQEHQKAKSRFDFLHAKLAHIKALVNEFDKTLTSSPASATTVSNSEPFGNLNNSRNRSSPSQSNGTSINVNMSNGSNNSNINAVSSARTSPPNSHHSIGSIPYSMTSGTSNLHHHLPKQENY